MYTERDRDALLLRITAFLEMEPEFEGLLQIGSGAVGYRDIYSDIDLMAGCVDCESVKHANEKLLGFLEEMGAVYVDRRRWSDRVLGLSAYFENGLSVDISYMPVEDVRLRSEKWKLLFSKSERFTDWIHQSGKHISREPRSFGIDDRVHHKFIYALRRCTIAALRGENIYGDMALNEARQYLLLAEAAREGKKLHQFKDFQTLNAAFLEETEKTYPSCRNKECLLSCADSLLNLYLDTVEKCDFLDFDALQLNLLNCFEECGGK